MAAEIVIELALIYHYEAGGYAFSVATSPSVRSTASKVVVLPVTSICVSLPSLRTVMSHGE